MALHNEFVCECGYRLQTAWGPNEGYFYRTFKCNSCKNYIIGQFRRYGRDRFPAFSDGKVIKIKAIAYLDETEKKGYGFKFNKPICKICGSDEVEELEEGYERLRSSDADEFDVPSKLDCPICGRKLIYKTWAIS